MGWILIVRGGANPLAGSTPCVAGKNYYFVPPEDISCDDVKWKIQYPSLSISIFTIQNKLSSSTGLKMAKEPSKSKKL